ncbi:MAG: hypothetical protein ABFD91_14020 [Anaerohalosphaeraceae bacterium]
MSLFLKTIGLLLLFLTLIFIIVGVSVKYGISENITIVVGMVLFIVFASYICFFFGKQKKLKAIKRIRKKMETLSPVPKETFEQAFDKEHIDIAYKARTAVALFYGIEPEKISPDCNMWNEFALELFEPYFLIYIEYKMFSDLHESLTRGTVVAAPTVSKEMDFAAFVRSLNTYKYDFIKRYNIQLNN